MTLYLGTDPTNFQYIPGLIHYPVIKTIPLPISDFIRQEFPRFTHVLFTSKNAVEIFLQTFSLEEKKVIAIGQSTAAKLQEKGWNVDAIAQPETQEGIIELLSSLNLNSAYLFYPRSSLARDHLQNYLNEQKISHQICDLYETVFQKPTPVPDLSTIREIIFTSPSTVKAFIAAFGQIPQGKKLTCIGPITEQALSCYSL